MKFKSFFVTVCQQALASAPVVATAVAGAGWRLGIQRPGDLEVAVRGEGVRRTTSGSPGLKWQCKRWLQPPRRSRDSRGRLLAARSPRRSKDS
jgi:hypothetical protein